MRPLDYISLAALGVLDFMAVYAFGLLGALPLLIVFGAIGYVILADTRAPRLDSSAQERDASAQEREANLDLYPLPRRVAAMQREAPARPEPPGA